MAIVDKIQSGIEKLTGDNTRLNSAEVTTIQQAYNALQLGMIKTSLYIENAQGDEVKAALREVRDDFLKPNLDKPRRILEQSGVPFLNLNVEGRLSAPPTRYTNYLRDEEILLDTVLALQATVTGLQAGALAAVRGDVRDWFLNARDAAFDQWRKVGYIMYKQMPQAIPPMVANARIP